MISVSRYEVDWNPPQGMGPPSKAKLEHTYPPDGSVMDSENSSKFRKDFNKEDSKKLKDAYDD